MLLLFGVNLCQALQENQSCPATSRRLPGICSLLYTERFLALNLDSLELRRRVADLVLVYKLICPSPHREAFTLFDFIPSSSKTRGHNLKIRQHHVNLNIRRYFFNVRLVDEWNSLPIPSHVVNGTYVEHFKRAVRNILAANYS